MKLNEQTLLEFRMELEELITDREGMIIENLIRQSLNQAVAYDEDSFTEIQAKIKCLRERLIKLGES